MKSILLTSSALVLVSAIGAGEARAECPEDIDAFAREYEKVLGSDALGKPLSADEQAELFGLRTTAENLHRSGNPEMCAEVIGRAQLLLDSAIAPMVLDPDDLVGMEVRNSADKELGEIDGVMVDPVSGRIAYVLLEHGGFLGIGDNLYAVPWRAITYVPGDERLLLDIDEERLENAPRYTTEEMTPEQRRSWLVAVHSYHGVDPYWQDSFSGDFAGTAAAQVGGSGESEVDAILAVPAGEGAASAAPREGQAAGDEPEAAQAPEGLTGGSGAGQDGESLTVIPLADGEQAQAGGSQAEGQAVRSQAQGGTEMPQAAAGDATGPELSLLAQRVGEIENQVEQLSQQGMDDELRTTLSNLEQRVEELSQQGVGEDVRTAIERLDQRVQELAQSGVGQDLRQTVSELDSRVQRLTGRVFGDSAGQAAAPAGSGQVVTTIIPSGRNESNAAPAPAQGTAQGASGGDQAATGPGARLITSGTRQTGGNASAGTATEPGTTARAGSQNSGTQASGAAGGGTMPPAIGTASVVDGNEPCETGIGRVEQDIARAEELGIRTESAQDELDEAQAMLQRASEALCRAAIKRARDELVSLGYQPTASN